jgi:GTP-binding protein
MFIDRVVVRVKAGDGGSGITSFRREKFVPMGGPDGGEGGRGGDIIIVGDGNLATLLDYTYRDSWTAPSGDHGSGSNRSGRSGLDVVMPVPIGTVVKDLETSELLGEVLEPGDRIIVAQGGRGGKGNSYFATATHQSPREYQPGEDGQIRTPELELKLIADVGLVGQPNAGKSTLLGDFAAHPKSATTLHDAEPKPAVHSAIGERSSSPISPASSKARTARTWLGSFCGTSNARESSLSFRSTRLTGRQNRPAPTRGRVVFD